MRAAQRITALAVAALTALASGSTASGAALEDRTLRIGTVVGFDSINPNLAFDETSAEAANLAFDPLVGMDADLDYAPTGFAERWTLDGTTWTFTIRDGLRWSDGRPATADDVAFTFRYLLASMDPGYVGPWAPAGNDVPRAGATRGDRRPDHPLSLYGDVLVDAVGLQAVEVIDERTVALTTEAPTTLILGALVPILPEGVWSPLPFDAAVTDAAAGPPVVGTGPFQVDDWVPGSSARFAPNPFHRGPRPYIDAIEVRTYADAAAMASALRGGDIDYARGLSPGDLDALDVDPDIVASIGKAIGFTHLAFNTYATPIDGGGASTAALRDPAFRDALGYALDHAAIIDAAVDGHATPGTTLIPPAVAPFHAEPSRPRRFDPNEARSRLDAAGYEDRDDDGVREDLEGQPLELRLVFPTADPRYAAAARAVAEGWAAIGIETIRQGFEPDTLTELLYVPEAGGTADYDVVLWSWTGSPDPDFLLGLLTSAEIGGWSDSNYANPAYDALFDAQRRASTPEDRRATVRRMLDLAYDDAPVHILFYDDELDAHRTDRFTGWAGPSGGTRLFTPGVAGYLDLAAAPIEPTPGPATPGPAASPSPSASPAPGVDLPTAAVDRTLGLAAGLGAIALAVLLLVAHRRRR